MYESVETLLGVQYIHANCACNCGVVDSKQHRLPPKKTKFLWVCVCVCLFIVSSENIYQIYLIYVYVSMWSMVDFILFFLFGLDFWAHHGRKMSNVTMFYLSHIKTGTETHTDTAWRVNDVCVCMYVCMILSK